VALNVLENTNLFLNSLKVGAFVPQITADICTYWNCVCNVVNEIQLVFSECWPWSIFCVLRYILVLMESLAGSGHFFAAKRLRLADKLELFRLDPWGTTLFSALSVFSLFWWYCLSLLF